MKNKNLALLISNSKNFVDQYSELLKKHDFEIFKLKEWNLRKIKSDYPYDACIVDNAEGNFQYEPLFEYIRNFSPQTIVIDVGSQNLVKPIGNHFLYVGQDKSIHLDSFLANLGEFFKRSRARTELAAMLIHDLRSPLHSMLSYIELLLNTTFGELNDGQKNFLEKAMVLGDQVLDMVEDINEIYQSEQHVFSLEKELFHIVEAIDQALLNLWIQADQKNIKIKKEVSPDLPYITGDLFQIQRVLMNLLGNAIKYCPNQSTIIIRAAQSSQRLLEISVIDNGGGIPEPDLKNIFKKLYRLPGDANQKKGQGLGLYICRLIVKAHGGTIRAENNNIGGASFIFTLPISAAV